MSGLVAPAELPIASSSRLAPLIERLLELHAPAHLERLSIESQDAILSLPEEDRPTSYEGLLDVARYCIDDTPGWGDGDKQVLIGGHPRIGAKGAISSSSRAEQKADVVDEESDRALARLNYLYEARYPGLRFVTYVAGRPRSAIAAELDALLGPSISSLHPPTPIADPDKPPSGTQQWIEGKVKALPTSSQAWQAELSRGLDALFEIAMDRAAKVSTSSSLEENVTAQSGAGALNDDDASFAKPFLTLDRFQTLVQSSPLLTTFFQVDLPSSFLVVPPPPPQETPRELLATLAAVAVTGGGGGDATRKRVKGLLGGLWGEVADRAGKVAGRETRTGPRPAFGREERLRGEEMRAKGLKTGLMSKSTPTAETSSSSAGIMADKNIENAEENLKLATQRLTDVDRSHFVIDEPAMDTSHDHNEDEEGEDLEVGMDRLGIDGVAEL